jgi:hypothetical protein
VDYYDKEKEGREYSGIREKIDIQLFRVRKVEIKCREFLGDRVHHVEKAACKVQIQRGFKIYGSNLTKVIANSIIPESAFEKYFLVFMICYILYKTIELYRHSISYKNTLI